MQQVTLNPESMFWILRYVESGSIEDQMEGALLEKDLSFAPRGGRLGLGKYGCVPYNAIPYRAITHHTIPCINKCDIKLDHTGFRQA